MHKSQDNSAVSTAREEDLNFDTHSTCESASESASGKIRFIVLAPSDWDDSSGSKQPVIRVKLGSIGPCTDRINHDIARIGQSVIQDAQATEKAPSGQGQLALAAGDMVISPLVQTQFTKGGSAAFYQDPLGRIWTLPITGKQLVPQSIMVPGV